MWRYIALVLFVGALIGTGLAFVAASGTAERVLAMIPTPAPPPTPTPVPCLTEDGQRVTERLTGILQEWLDTVKVAGATSRIALSGPVAQLQRIRRDTQSAHWPQCSEQAKRHLVQMMDDQIEGFLGFMRDERTYERHFRAADDQFASFTGEIAKMGR